MLLLLQIEPGRSLPDARAYGFQFLRIAASKAFLPPGGACLDVWHDRIEILLALCAAGIPRGQDIKRFVARAKLPEISDHMESYFFSNPYHPRHAAQFRSPSRDTF